MIDRTEATPDPFDEFNRHQGMQAIRDPYPAFARMSRKGPIHRVAGPFGEPLAGQPDASAPVVFSVCSHDAIAEVLRDAQRFDSSGYQALMGGVMGHTILGMDGAEHDLHRGLLQAAFSRKALARWETEVVEPIVSACIDGFAEDGHADLVRELCFPFPVAVIARMIGIPEALHVRFHRLAVEMISISFAPERGLAASAALAEMFGAVLEERRSRPREDLMSVLSIAEIDGARLSDAEIISFCRLLAPAGAETTYRSSSNLLLGLLSHPEQLEAVRRDRALIPRAIEEGLRWECPLTGILRTSTRDTELCGISIPSGAVLHLNLGAANRDEARYEHPDEFDIFRKAQTNLAFGFGTHRCLGMHLATMETRVALESLIDRLPGLRLDPEAKDVHVTGLVFRSPLALPIGFDVRD